MPAAVSASTRTGSRILALASRYRNSIRVIGFRNASTSSTTCAGSSARMLRYTLLTGATVAADGSARRDLIKPWSESGDWTSGPQEPDHDFRLECHNNHPSDNNRIKDL